MSMSVSLDPLFRSRWRANRGYNARAQVSDPRARLMTLSSLKIHLALPVLLAVSSVCAADELDAAIANAGRAVAAAEEASPRGDAARALDQARGQWQAAIEARDKRRKTDALRLAEVAAANADLANARARLDAARELVDSRAARNAELRRRHLVNGGRN